MTMKRLIAILAVATTGLVLFPQTAAAGHSRVGVTYQSGRSSCGCPVYTRRSIKGYDCYRRPVYRYVRVPVIHRCRHHGNAAPRYRRIDPCRSNHYYVDSFRGRSAPRYGYRSGYRPAYSRTCR